MYYHYLIRKLLVGNFGDLATGQMDHFTLDSTKTTYHTLTIESKYTQYIIGT